MYDFLLELPRTTKRALLFGADFVLVVLALLIAFALRFGMINPLPVAAENLTVVIVVAMFGAFALLHLGPHRIKLQSLELKALQQIGLVAITLSLVAMATSYLLQAGTPRSVPLIFGFAFFFLAVGFRMLAVTFLFGLRDLTAARAPTIIYGAGSAGIQIASALRNSSEFRPVAFLDDNPALQELQIGGLKVRAPAELPRLIEKWKATKIVLAMASISTARRLEIFENLRGLGCDVQMLPSHAELLSSGTLLDNLRSVDPDELLGRDKVDLDVPEVTKSFAARSVMVTGAGGSIGSELCRQLVDCRPRQIVLFENSEIALYEIERDLRALLQDDSDIRIVPRLGSVTNPERVRNVIAADQVEIILHAAAYKHVPLVEQNEVEGARNNILGTRVVATAACEADVERFILVSTDKAVRPTNIMGATKRLAELVIQDLQRRNPRTKLAMVRFGNVLGSSGSVFPLFQKQIEAGGPVTVTHPEVTRFFMTIPEAARLVLLAGAFSKGADVFVLDMGKPMKIIDVAKRMIQLSGQSIGHPGRPDGIEIRITGLRPGEKLYEELLIDDGNLRVTPHEKILRAEEHDLSEIEVVAMLRKLTAAIEADDQDQVRSVIREYVEGYQPAAAPEDRACAS